MERKKIEAFEDLLVWQKGIELVKQIYALTANGKLNRVLECGISCSGRRFRFQRILLRVSSGRVGRNIFSSLISQKDLPVR